MTFDPVRDCPHGCLKGKCAQCDLMDVNIALETVEAENEVLRATIKSALKWCHQGHGDFPAKGCGLCSPLLAALKEPE